MFLFMVRFLYFHVCSVFFTLPLVMSLSDRIEFSYFSVRFLCVFFGADSVCFFGAVSVCFWCGFCVFSVRFLCVFLGAVSVLFW